MEPMVFLFRLGGWVWRVLSRRPWALILLGVALLAAAPLYYAGKEPVCGGETMEPGDRCRSGRDRVTTYEQEVSEQSWNKWIVAGLGAITVCGGAYAAVRKRHPTAGSAAPASPSASRLPPPPPPPHPPTSPPAAG